tara:strand:+ start:2731 stop:3072 length:342 start_codon:yes stop_codon:yes gene_type:complete
MITPETKYVFYDDLPRKVESLAEDNEHIWLAEIPGSSRSYALLSDCIPLSYDEELILRDPVELSDEELELVLDMLAKDRMVVSDKKRAPAKKKESEPGVKVTGDVLQMLGMTE